jgi:hypothetical protein
MDELRENMQLEKLRALKPVADLANDSAGAPAQRKPGLSSLKSDPKAMGKEIQEEVMQMAADALRPPRRCPRACLPPHSRAEASVLACLESDRWVSAHTHRPASLLPVYASG